VVITAANREFRVRVNGVLQVVQLPVGNTARSNVAGVLQGLLTGVTVALDTTQPNKLRLTTVRRGTSASLQVVSAGLGFQPGPVTIVPASATTNNVGDLSAVTLADVQAQVAALNAGLPSGTDPVLAVVELAGGRFALRTTQTNSTAALGVDATGSLQTSTAFGLPTPGSAAAGTGSETRFFQKATVGAERVWHRPGDTNNRLNEAATLGQNLDLLSFSAVFDGEDGDSTVYDDLAFNRVHPRFAGTSLPEHPAARADALRQPIWFDIGSGVDPMELYALLFPVSRTSINDGRRVAVFDVQGGNDGRHGVLSR